MRSQELRFVGRSLIGLQRQLGVRRGAAAMIAGVMGPVLRDPFTHLPPAACPRERASRRQAATAVCIYRALLRSLPRERAVAAMGPLIETGALLFLAKTLPEVSLSALGDGDDASRVERVRGWMSRFFTATMGQVSADASGVTFEVTACALVRLAHAAGHPELAPLFCKGDETFFELRGIQLKRPFTIAGGGERCRFELRPR